MDSLQLEVSRDDALKVLEDPAIFETISEDGVSKIPMPEGPIYLCGYVPELVGCFIVYKRSRVSAECHVQVLPEYREQYAEAFGRAVIDWTWENTDLQKLVAEIPLIYPNVKDFACRMGFGVEGINRLSHRKNGNLVDQFYMGLIRPGG